MSTYDPLYQAHCQGEAFASSYWASTCQLEKPMAPPQRDHTYDVIVIGGGFTGLLSAFYLATEFNQKVCILEANQVGFGASARNAGFALPSSGRLSALQMGKKWGVEIAQQIYHEYQTAVSRVAELIDQHDIECDKQEQGYIKIAHSHNAAKGLLSGLEYSQNVLNDNHLSFIHNDELQANYINTPNSFGAVRTTHGFGLNPLKLVRSYKSLVQQVGVDLYEQSLAQQLVKKGQAYRVKVNDIHITAKKVIIAGNAYNNRQIHHHLNNRYLPILSSILVTRPLSTDELIATGLKTHQVMMDTRTLKYYYRLLPDNRLLFGGRGAVFGKDQAKLKYRHHLEAALKHSFPALQNCHSEYHWHGYIAAALDDHPHIYCEDNLAYAIGYCGSGVAFSAQAAYRLAQMVSGQPVPKLPIYQTPAPKFPFATLSRLGQYGFYNLAILKDRLY
ncbi:FAD-binding oxidoreductase [Pseudoalteromonas sp. SMS1]|uniref:NAD(P)/FAD-dependent oxidoreductase n=1 Tax=Pseudoalteromonas sp. SMS1 TaxID=2908894 RepID=UPI001F293603|nr:FAD-binding oxidoreductase [Pseudoalteromonas sp. SMS1]MCF2857624.1 FAD-binding oxidoreductase [Pseudoalteromonas sp. SMS1]